MCFHYYYPLQAGIMGMVQGRVILYVYIMEITSRVELNFLHRENPDRAVFNIFAVEYGIYCIAMSIANMLIESIKTTSIGKC